MSGELLAVWTETRREIWDVLASQDGAPNDLYCELFRTLSAAFSKPLTSAELAEIVDDAEQSKSAFYAVTADVISGERALCTFYENLYDELDELNGELLTKPYVEALSIFIKKFSLRYELTAPCKLSPTIEGVFSGLLSDLRLLTSKDPHLCMLMDEFDVAIRDLSIDSSEGRIKICIQKQMNLLEGIAQKSPLVTKGDLAGMCGELKNWPHAGIKTSVACLYSFASDYPGIRHGGKPEKVLRNIEMRDLISLSILLSGCIPYLSDEINPTAVFWRS